MNLSDLQSKDIVDIKDGKKIGTIIDVIINRNGALESLIIQKNKFNFNFLTAKEDLQIKWEQIKKIGEDVILVDIR